MKFYEFLFTVSVAQLMSTYKLTKSYSFTLLTYKNSISN